MLGELFQTQQDYDEINKKVLDLAVNKIKKTLKHYLPKRYWYCKGYIRCLKDLELIDVIQYVDLDNLIEKEKAKCI